MRIIATPLDYCKKINWLKFYCRSTADVLPISGPKEWVEWWFDYHNSVRQWGREEGII